MSSRADLDLCPGSPRHVKKKSFPVHPWLLHFSYMSLSSMVLWLTGTGWEGREERQKQVTKSSQCWKLIFSDLTVLSTWLIVMDAKMCLSVRLLLLGTPTPPLALSWKLSLLRGWHWTLTSTSETLWQTILGAVFDSDSVLRFLKQRLALQWRNVRSISRAN